MVEKSQKNLCCRYDFMMIMMMKNIYQDGESNLGRVAGHEISYRAL